MLKKVSMSLVALVTLSACSACSTLPETDIEASAAMPMAAEGSSMSKDAGMGAGKMAKGSSTAVAVAMGNTVHFAFDSAALTKDAQAHLRIIADKVKSENPAKVVVEGHADERGTREYNLALGDRRAVAAKKYLVGLGVDSSKISTISYGKERPMDAAHTAEAWAKNRRSTVVFE